MSQFPFATAVPRAVADGRRRRRIAQRISGFFSPGNRARFEQSARHDLSAAILPRHCDSIKKPNRPGFTRTAPIVDRLFCRARSRGTSSCRSLFRQVQLRLAGVLSGSSASSVTWSAFKRTSSNGHRLRRIFKQLRCVWSLPRWRYWTARFSMLRHRSLAFSYLFEINWCFLLLNR